MKVKAKFSQGKFGFYGSRRRYDGDEFEIDPAHFSEMWMVKIEDEKPKRGRKPNETHVIDAGEGAE